MGIRHYTLAALAAMLPLLGLSLAPAAQDSVRTTGKRTVKPAASEASAMNMADPVGSFAPMLARVIPAVVTVRVTSETAVPVEFKPGSSQSPVATPRKVVSRSGGSGVIVDPSNGHILTNNHVIENAVQIDVVLADGRLIQAKLIGKDIGSDLAVIEVAQRDLPSLPIGNSDAVRVGDVVAAVGNPFGLEGTATLGIVSASMRSDIGHEAFEDFLQIDAVINPGNSGGALVNVRGELIGINTATAGTAGNVGIGFAIPINMARVIKSEIVRHGGLRRGSPGLIVEDLSYERARDLMSGTNRGAIITEIVPASPAANAGVKLGAIVTAINGKPVRGATELNSRVATVPLGTMLDFVLRVEGQDRHVLLPTADIKLTTPEIAIPPEMGGLEGAVVSDIVLGNPNYGNVRGAQVIRVAQNSPAHRTGLVSGDIIVGLDSSKVRSPNHLLRYAGRAGMSYRLDIVRDGVAGWLRVDK